MELSETLVCQPERFAGLTWWMPFSAASLAISASRSAGIPASGPYWLSSGSDAAAATASSAAAGGAQYTMPACI